MPYVTVKGINIYFESTIGNSLPIVLVHGAGGSSQLWSEQLSIFKEPIQLLGYGLTWSWKIRRELALQY